jgi:hypothetical protein
MTPTVLRQVRVCYDLASTTTADASMAFRLADLLQGVTGRAVRREERILLISLVVSAACVVVDGILLPRIHDASSFLFQMLELLDAVFLLGLLSGLIWTVVCLIRRKWLSASCYVITAMLAPASMYASAVLQDDLFPVPSPSHQEIAAIYQQRQSELERSPVVPRLVPLGDACHPPSGCGCWIVLDPAHTSGAEKEIGGWHRPADSSIFPLGALPEDFAIVNVQRLGPKAYSAIGCDVDWSALKPV